MITLKLDNIDKKILHHLQLDGRMSIAALARAVNLSSSPCFERVKRLEQQGYIEGYYAKLSAKKLALGLLVFVQIRLDRTSNDIFKRFKASVLLMDEVIECHLVSGNFDYLIKARVKDMDAYRILLGETLLKLPGVQESTSYVVMEQLKESVKLPMN